MPSRPAPEPEIVQDHLRRGLDLVIVGINPGLASAAARSHYAGPTNHFWPLLYESGLVGEPLSYLQSKRVLLYNIGLTNLVSRPSRGIDNLSHQEMMDGAELLRAKLRRYRPCVIAFNGKSISEVFLLHKVAFGVQPMPWEGMVVFVMPSTSARAASYQRPAKLAFFQELKRLVDRECTS